MSRDGVGLPGSILHGIILNHGSICFPFLNWFCFLLILDFCLVGWEIPEESYSAPEQPASGGSSSTSASAPARKAAGTTAAVEGKETFRAVAKAGSGSYKVIHCGNTIATFTLQDADGNAKACKSVALKKLDSGRWSINYTVDDSEGLTVAAPLDRTYMYDTLGVSCISINDTVIIDIEAEAAAAKAAK